MAFGTLLLRTVIGFTLAAHGSRKLFGWFGGPGLEKTAAGMEALGFAPGQRHALMAGAAEFAGGLLIALGLATPLGAAIIAGVMLVAAITAHVKRGFFITTGGFEYNMVLATAAVSIAFTGPGPMSLDALFGYAEGGALNGLGALAVGGAGAALQLAQRRMPRPAPAG